MKVANERLVLFSSSYFRCIMTIATFYRLPDIKTLAYIILQNFLRSIYVRRDIFVSNVFEISEKLDKV